MTSDPNRSIITVHISEKALQLIERIYQTYQKQLIMIVSTGCCESAAPFLFADYVITSSMQKIWGNEQVVLYLQPHVCVIANENSLLSIDVEENVLSDSFSIESDYGCRFVLNM